jgi:mRNA interferase MazF
LWRQINLNTGLLTDSVIMTDNLATVLDKAVASKLGQLEDMETVDAALRATLAL